MTVLYKEGATQQQEDEANAILGILEACYPGHPWGVRVMEGGFFIQYLLVPFNKPYGMFCKYTQFGYSASAMKKEIVMMAGEWLERAGLARGGFEEGQEITEVEGVNERRVQLPHKIVVEQDSRESLRPQAKALDG